MARVALLCLLSALLLGCSSDSAMRMHEGLQEAAQLYRDGHTSEAGARWRSVVADAEKTADAHGEAAEAYAGLGQVELKIGSPLIAERFFHRSLAHRQSASGVSTIEYGQALGGLATAYARQGRLKEAISSAREALATQAEVRGVGREEALAAAQQQLARLLQESTRIVRDPAVQREAARLYSQVLAFQRSVLGDDSPDILPYAVELQSVLVDIKDSPDMQRIREEAEAILARAQANHRRQRSR